MIADLCILLECIDIFWRTLEVLWSDVGHEDDFTYDDELQNFKIVYEQQPPLVKKNRLTKLRGIVNPGSVTIREPVVHKNTRGRPSAKDKRKQTNHFVQPIVDPRRRSYSKYTKAPDLNEEPARHNS